METNLASVLPHYFTDPQNTQVPWLVQSSSSSVTFYPFSAIINFLRSYITWYCNTCLLHSSGMSLQLCQPEVWIFQLELEENTTWLFVSQASEGLGFLKKSHSLCGWMQIYSLLYQKYTINVLLVCTWFDYSNDVWEAEISFLTVFSLGMKIMEVQKVLEKLSVFSEGLQECPGQSSHTKGWGLDC